MSQGRPGTGVLVLGAILVLGAAMTAPARATSPRMSADLDRRIRAAAPDDLLPVIIQTTAPPTSAHFTRLHGRGGSIVRKYSALGGYAAQIPAAQIALFAEDPEVGYVAHDAPVRAHLDVAYRAIRADVARLDGGAPAGTGVGIALIDTGVQAHPDLQRARQQASIVEVEIVGREPGLTDFNGHGTHVAGILAGNGAASGDRAAFRAFRGLAPGARLISIRALQPDGSGSTSDVIAGIDWAIRFKTAYDIRVINLSLGHPVYESYRVDPLCRAVRAAHDAGIVVVVAAGNDGEVGTGFGTISSPGNEPTAITVGAMDDSGTPGRDDDVLAWYSSKGPTLIDHVVKPDLVAPGTWIVSTRAPGSSLDRDHHGLVLRVGDYRDDPVRAAEDGDYVSLAGTSLAVPFVAATAALMIQQEPDLTPATVKARLMRSASKDDLMLFESGAGHLDVPAALAERGRASIAISPRAFLAPDGSVEVEEIGRAWNVVNGDDASAWPAEAVWGGQKHTREDRAVENDRVTSDGLIWSGGGWCLADWTSAVDILGAIWGDRKAPKK